jgi:diguanylate cyclase (GGDEF)-like protein
MARHDHPSPGSVSEALAAAGPRPYSGWLAPLLRVLGLSAFRSPLYCAAVDQRIAALIYGAALLTASVWAVVADEPSGHWPRILSRLFMVSLVALGGLGWALESRRLDQSVQHVRQEALQHLALSDDLTGLANRRAFFQRLQQEWSRYQRSARPFTVIILDLDGFKQINDRFGHQTGDRALQWLAGHLRRCLRQEDLAARLGGDEFALLLPETSAQSGQAVLDRLCTAVAADHSLVDARLGTVIRLRVSGGAATPDTSTLDADHLVLVADTQLYARKSERAILAMDG